MSNFSNIDAPSGQDPSGNVSAQFNSGAKLRVEEEGIQMENQYGLANRDSNLGSRPNMPTYDERNQKRNLEQKQWNTNVKYCFTVIFALCFTLGVNLTVHTIDMNTIEKAGQENHERNQQYIENLKLRMDDEFPDQNFTSFDSMNSEHPIQKTLTQLSQNLTESQKRQQHKIELELIKLFQSTPDYTSAATIKKWKDLGPLPIGKQIDYNMIEPDWRYEVECIKNVTKGRKYCGQQNFFDLKHSHGIGRTEYLSGDLYEGENIHGLKNGYGRYVWKNGDYYIGSFKNGKLDGNGLYVDSKGKKTNGKFRLGIYVG